MDPALFMWFAVGGLFVAALSAVGNKVLNEFSRHELENYCRIRNREDLFGEILDDHEKAALGADTLQILGIALALFCSARWLNASVGALSKLSAGAAAGWFVAGILALLILIVWLPRAIAALWSAPLVYHTWRIWRITNLILLPLSFGGRLVDVLLHRLAGRTSERPAEEEFEDELRAIVTEGLRDGVVEADVREMIEGVIELADVDIADIMTPRSDVDAMELKADWSEMLEFVIRVRRTRIPVYEKKLDNIVGILHVKDLLPELAKGSESARRPLKELLRDPWFLPKTKPVDDLLQEFQRSGNHIVIVVDEYMTTAGVVTIEDVLEEIVGEIFDEHDQDVVDEIIKLDDNTTEMPARVHIDEVNERFGLSLPEGEDYDTIGGFISVKLGRMPKSGDQVRSQLARITVTEVSRRRVERVRVEILPETQRESA